MNFPPCTEIRRRWLYGDGSRVEFDWNSGPSGELPAVPASVVSAQAECPVRGWLNGV